MIYQRRGCGISLSRQVCIARPILSVKELNAKDHMHSRLLSAPILATAKGAGPPWQWPLCDPDPQARRGSGPGPGDGPVARQSLGGVVGDAEAVAGPACSSSELPPIPESRQSPSPRCYMLAAAQRPLSMCLASSPRHHLRPSTLCCSPLWTKPQTLFCRIQNVGYRRVWHHSQKTSKVYTLCIKS